MEHIYNKIVKLSMFGETFELVYCTEIELCIRIKKKYIDTYILELIRKEVTSAILNKEALENIVLPLPQIIIGFDQSEKKSYVKIF